ncbi:MAG: glycosyltransferase [Cupriavidus sp.]|nr:glycosyltransferase [Cupriavidus sp.]
MLTQFLLSDFFRKHHRILINWLIAPIFRLRAKCFPRKAVLYVGQSYYHAWYLSRSLRKLGWKADVLNWDANESSMIYYHGEDVRFRASDDVQDQLAFYLRSIVDYDVFHFSNKGGIAYGYTLQGYFAARFGLHFEIELLRKLGKKIIYSHTGCLDGVSQTSFSKWGPHSICAICPWRNRPDVCSDEGNIAWGEFRNAVADYQCTLGGNRVDCNMDPRVHETPGFFCLDSDFWRPDLVIPERFQLNFPEGTIKLYHAVGNLESRTDKDGVNIKSTHIYLPLIQRLKDEGYPIELLSYTNVPNKEIRFYQAQADIVLDMLTYGFFGANGREALMLGKPFVCFVRPEWLDSMRDEIPEYVDELPVISATPETVYDVLKDLLDNPEKRAEIGRRSRAFAVKWHSADSGAVHFDRVYQSLLRGNAEFRGASA